MPRGQERRSAVSCQVTEVRKSDRFHLETNTGISSAIRWSSPPADCRLAKLGATDFGYRSAAQFGLRVTELRPGLVPLTFMSRKVRAFPGSAGVPLPVVARAGAASFDEAMLFTHRGLSGPAILQVSSYL